MESNNNNISRTIYDPYKVGTFKCDDIKKEWYLNCTEVNKSSPLQQQQKCQHLFKEFIHCALDFYLKKSS